MRRTAPWTIGLIILCALTLSACIPTSEHPVGSGEGSSSDPELFGVWTGPVGDRHSFVHILPSTRGDEDPNKAGMDLLLVAHPTAEDPEEFGWVLAHAFATKIGETRYLSVKWEVEDRRPLEGEDAGFHILAYSLSDGGELRFQALNEEPIVEAIESGNLQGEIVPSRYFRTVRLTAPPDALRRFFEGADPAILFGTATQPLVRLAQ